MTIDMAGRRAQRREAQKQSVTVNLGDDVNGGLVYLPVEMPVDVLEPFLGIEIDKKIATLLAIEEESREQFARDLFVSEPGIFTKVIVALREAVERLFGDDWPRLVATRPTMQDMGVLGSGLFTEYGASLGEAFGSLTSSSSGGATSQPTSSASTASTPAAPSSGTSLEKPPTA